MLRKKIMLLVVIISTVSCLAMYLGLAVPSMNRLYEKDYSLVKTSVSQLSSQCEELLNVVENLSYTFLGLDDLYDTLSESSTRQYSSDHTQKIADLRTLTAHFLTRPSIYSVAFFDANGHTLLQAINSITEDNCQSWLQSAFDKRTGKTWSDTYITQNLTDLRTDIRVVSLFRPVVSPNTYQLVGAMRITILEDSLSALLQSGRVELSQAVYLCDSSGRIISAPDKSVIGNTLDFLPASDFSGSEVHLLSSKASERFFVQRIGSYDAYIVEVLPTDYLQQLTHSLWSYSVFLLVMLWLGILLYAVLTSRMLVKPVNTLVQQMQRIEQGDLNQKIDVISQDEIGLLSTSFNHMVQSLRTSQEALIQSRMKVHDLHMQTLRLQLNPHFLLNSLDNIRWIALEQGNLVINSYIECFSAIMRDVLSQKRVSTVYDEIRLVENYIDLERLRFDNCLSFDYSVPEELFGCPMLPFILQPILENAITHGFPDKAADNSIFLIVERRNEDLLIDVSDNGIGADEEKVRRIIAGEPRSHVSILNNINARIHLYFGSDYHGGVRFFSKPNMGTRVTVTLPADPAAYAKLESDDALSEH